ncbi:alpha/beta fold hydrolase [Microvirga antarctica]|uniref:alpha/beta fold hydrolase n=1 Tax=Microvirga antarctica TaxID=2819233 RepID=UPI001B30EAB0|nr:alpha/beta fold hydrolase [Microvirga antarctica]
MADTLLLIPGLGNTERLFEHQIATFRGLMSVAVADHRQDDTVAGIAARALAGAPARFALAGLSMGGYVAMEIMRQAPERVERLALLDTTAGADTAEARDNRERLIALAEADDLDGVLADTWPKLVHARHRDNEVLKEVVADMLRETGPAAYIRQQRAIMSRPDSRPTLSEIEIPTLVLVGEGDAITPVETAREMAEMIEWSSLFVVRGAGHLSALDEPEAVTAALRLWLERP